MKLLEPALSAALAERADLLPCVRAARAEDEAVTRALFEGEALEGADFSGTEFEGVLFRRCRLSGCDLSRCQFTDVLFEGCDLSGCDLTESNWCRCAFHDGKAVGGNLRGCHLRHVRFAGALLQYINLAAANVRLARFEDTDLTGAVLSEWKWKDLELVRVGLSGVNFFRTLLAGLDLTSCTVEGLTLSAHGEELRGAVVSSGQAVELSKVLGLVVRD